MLRSRLKNIINKSNAISNKQEIGNPFDEFKKSLPIEVDDNYRLEAAWKAYGSPKDYKTALWYGMIQPIDETNVKLPSIGYNEETDEYEYLNKGRENETVNRDIRVWDNNVIPFVKELKLGGFIRVYDEEKDCWKYSKNKPQETLVELGKVIELFLLGGKPSKKKDWNSYYEFLETLPQNLLKGNDTDTLEGYRMKLLFDNTPNLWTFEDGLKGENPIFTKQEDGYYAPSVLKMPDGHYEFLKSYSHPSFKKEIEWYNSDNAKSFREKYTLKSKNNYGVPLTYYQYIPNDTQAFKQGGQLNIIPEGSLHARKNNMEGAGENFTAKGIPVMTADGKELVAEIEKNEIVFNKEVTDFIEANYKKFNSDISNTEKDELAIKVGKRLVKEILDNTDDRTGLIEEVLEKM